MTYPVSPKFASVAIRSNDPTLYSQSVNGRIQTRKVAGQQWEFSASYPPLTRTEFQPVSAYIDSLRGQHTVFTVVPTEVASTSATGVSGTVTCTSAALGAVSVPSSGLTGTLKAGDFIKFSGHTKVYKLTADRAGNGNLSIVPPLTTAVTTDTVTYNNVPFTVRLKNDVQEYAIGVDMLHKFEVDFVEALS